MAITIFSDACIMSVRCHIFRESPMYAYIYLKEQRNALR